MAVSLVIVESELLRPRDRVAYGNARTCSTVWLAIPFAACLPRAMAIPRNPATVVYSMAVMTMNIRPVAMMSSITVNPSSEVDAVGARRSRDMPQGWTDEL